MKGERDSGAPMIAGEIAAEALVISGQSAEAIHPAEGPLHGNRHVMHSYATGLLDFA